MVDGFDHAGVPVADVPRAVDFYESVLGLERIGPDDPDADVESADYFWMAAGDGQWVNLAARPDAVPDGPNRLDDPHLAFRASEGERREVAERLAARDVEFEETSSSLYVRDPAGNLVEVVDWAGPAAHHDHL